MDTFLLQHELSAVEYEIGGGFLNVSVRDMIFRARLLIDRLVALHRITVGQRLLIVGAGVSGVTAALQAAKHGLRPVLIEETASSLSRFDNCTSRRLDPYLYNWPAPCWRNTTYPEPLGGTAGPPHTLVTHWRDLCLKPALASKAVEIRLNQQVERAQVTATPHGVVLAGDVFPYALVIWAGGVGTENTRICDHVGQAFWSDGARYTGRVLIVGTGDGALQDFIVATTGLHPAMLIEKLETEIGNNLDWEQAKSRVAYAQEQALSQFVWGRKAYRGEDLPRYYKDFDIAVCDFLHDAFLAEIRKIRSTGLRTAIYDVLMPGLTRHGRPKRVDLVPAGKSFTWCFALNRFLTLLILQVVLGEAIALESGGLPRGAINLFSPTQVDEISSTTPHTVRFNSTSGRSTETYDEVLVRIGITPPPRHHDSLHQRLLLPQVLTHP